MRMETTTAENLVLDSSLRAFVQGDCLEAMKCIPDASIDFLFADLPYGTTICPWDSLIAFEPFWEQVMRVTTDTAVMALTASEPFTSTLIESNKKLYRYSWVWEKTRPTGSVHANHRPMKAHEDIPVFFKKRGIYNPQMTEAKSRKEKEYEVKAHPTLSPHPLKRKFDNKGLAYPRSVIKIPNPNHNNIHPTQKPVKLLEYLIKTYTNEDDVVLDPCAGSGTTAVACDNLSRRWICIEQDKEYCDDATERISRNRQERTDLFS